MNPKQLINVYEANDILKHLINTNQAFCFLPDGRFVTREDCKEKLEACNFVEGF
jgi:hypothetical protein